MTNYFTLNRSKQYYKRFERGNTLFTVNLHRLFLGTLDARPHGEEHHEQQDGADAREEVRGRVEL